MTTNELLREIAQRNWLLEVYEFAILERALSVLAAVEEFESEMEHVYPSAISLLKRRAAEILEDARVK